MNDIEGIFNGENSENMFQKISFDDAYKNMKENDRLQKDFREKGAVLNGTSDLDIKYTKHMETAAEYLMNFSQNELLALLGRSLSE